MHPLPHTEMQDGGVTEALDVETDTRDKTAVVIRYDWGSFILSMSLSCSGPASSLFIDAILH